MYNSIEVAHIAVQLPIFFHVIRQIVRTSTGDPDNLASKKRGSHYCAAINCNHSDRNCNSNHQISAERSVIQALAHRTKLLCSTLELLAKEMDYLNKVLHRKSNPE